MRAVDIGRITLHRGLEAAPTQPSVGFIFRGGQSITAFLESFEKRFRILALEE